MQSFRSNAYFYKMKLLEHHIGVCTSDLPEKLFEDKMSFSAIAQFLYIVEDVKQRILLTEQITLQLAKPYFHLFTNTTVIQNNSKLYFT